MLSLSLPRGLYRARQEGLTKEKKHYRAAYPIYTNYLQIITLADWAGAGPGAGAIQGSGAQVELPGGPGVGTSP